MAHAGPPGASISSTSTPWPLRGWMKATGPSAPRAAPVDELDPTACELVERRSDVGDLEADVVEALPLAGQEARHAVVSSVGSTSSILTRRRAGTRS